MTVNSIKQENVLLEFKPISDMDLPFLYKVYRSTRIQEMQITNWSNDEIERFLQMQFYLQHIQYMGNYDCPSFTIIVHNEIPIGRLYINRFDDEIRIIDIAILPEYRNKGIGSKIIKSIIAESEIKKIPISLHVEHNNTAIDFYRRFDFTLVNDLGVYILMKRFPKKTGKEVY